MIMQQKKNQTSSRLRSPSCEQQNSAAMPLSKQDWAVFMVPLVTRQGNSAAPAGDKQALGVVMGQLSPCRGGTAALQVAAPKTNQKVAGLGRPSKWHECA